MNCPNPPPPTRNSWYVLSNRLSEKSIHMRNVFTSILQYTSSLLQSVRNGLFDNSVSLSSLQSSVHDPWRLFLTVIVYSLSAWIAIVLAPIKCLHRLLLRHSWSPLSPHSSPRKGLLCSAASFLSSWLGLKCASKQHEKCKGGCFGLAEFPPSPDDALIKMSKEACSGWMLLCDPQPPHEGQIPIQRGSVWQYVGNSRGDGEVTSGDVCFNAYENPNAVDYYSRNQLATQRAAVRKLQGWKVEFSMKFSKESDITRACSKGIKYWIDRQALDGSWVGDYGGPHFLIPGLVVATYVSKHELPHHVKAALKLYVLNHQQVDGGWGLHIEGGSTMLCTVLNYIALRLLGVETEDVHAKKARAFIANHGGYLRTPVWGKVWMAILGVYSWEGVIPILPEPSLFPIDYIPFHPGRFWNHCRFVFLPISYLYGLKFSCRQTPLVMEIRSELCPEGYDNVNWNEARRMASADTDQYQPISRVCRWLFEVLHYYDKYVASEHGADIVGRFLEKCDSRWMPSGAKRLVGDALWKLRVPFRFARQWAISRTFECISAEDISTNYLCLGPVNKMFNMVSVFAATNCKDTVEMTRHIQTLEAYLWLADDGMKVHGEPYGSVTWDTSFTILALSGSIENEPEPHVLIALDWAVKFLAKNQMLTDIDKQNYHRDSPVGGWGFTRGIQNWPVSDTTSNAISAILSVRRMTGIGRAVADSSLYKAVDLVLRMQNPCGSWGTYEKYRGGRWLEMLCPMECFDNSMVDYPCVECTASSVCALHSFQCFFGNYRRDEILKAIRQGVDFIMTQQIEEGGWYGSWGVCFTYGTWFALEALRCVPTTSTQRAAVEKACRFLLDRQRDDGGWTESFTSCVKKRYIERDTEPNNGYLEEPNSENHSQSQVVQTSWAILGLIAGNCKNFATIDRAALFLVNKQQKDGDWPTGRISGVFNGTVGISYSAYRNVFPIMALSKVHFYRNPKSRNQN
eukprot:GHVQ01015140.1.p1 GENE.GHVQ01015140.1~~GHVQ01015140.1.p1  ORF type:complete len:968 (+),score=67.33 GHVQ01015140.1:399-3302(+)